MRRAVLGFLILHWQCQLQLTSAPWPRPRNGVRELLGLAWLCMAWLSRSGQVLTCSWHCEQRLQSFLMTKARAARFFYLFTFSRSSCSRRAARPSGPAPKSRLEAVRTRGCPRGRFRELSGAVLLSPRNPPKSCLSIQYIYIYIYITNIM